MDVSPANSSPTSAATSPTVSSPATSFANSSPPAMSPATSSATSPTSSSSAMFFPATSPAVPSPATPMPRRFAHQSHLFRVSHLVLPDGSYRSLDGPIERLYYEPQVPFIPLYTCRVTYLSMIIQHSVLPSPTARAKLNTSHWPRSQSKDMHESNLRLRDLSSTRQQLLKRTYVHFLGEIMTSPLFPIDVTVWREMASSAYHISMTEHISIKNYRGSTSPIEGEISLVLFFSSVSLCSSHLSSAPSDSETASLPVQQSQISCSRARTILRLVPI